MSYKDYVKVSGDDSKIDTKEEKITYKDIVETKSIAETKVNDKEIPETKTSIIELIDVIDSDDGGFIYDIIHTITDFYVSGRILIENNYFNLSSNEDFNLVYPNIYIGNYSTSTNLALLNGIGITHIISVLPTFNPPFNNNFKYLHIKAYDDECQDMIQYFNNSNEFIKNCLNEGGKILIHCMVGRSRSVTIFIAFLIYIIQGKFNQSTLNLEQSNDIYNSIEYKKIIENLSQIKSEPKHKKTKNQKHNEYNEQHNEDEKITTHDHVKPQLSKKDETFIIYKKHEMVNDINNLINKYKLLKQEIVNMSNYPILDTEESKETFLSVKYKISYEFINQIIFYAKKYRSISCPNAYFVKQLCDILL